MKITNTIHGWLIEPSTDKEEAALEFLMGALQDRYAVSVVTQDSESANRLPLLAPVPSTETVV
jgi:hypothetical protein